MSLIVRIASYPFFSAVGNAMKAPMNRTVAPEASRLDFKNVLGHNSIAPLKDRVSSSPAEVFDFDRSVIR